jgi:hypothetical protein
MSEDSARIAAARSANDRIKQQARQKGGDVNGHVNFLRSRFVFERMLCRVSAAGYDDRWMLKGGVLMLALTTDVHRTTQDIDFTLRMATVQVDSVVAALHEICAATPESEDGVTFRLDMTTSKTMPKVIGEFRDKPTVRATLVATLHCDRPVEHRFIVDATAAEIEHEPVMREWQPTVRGFDPILVPSYPWEVVVAEKLHSVVTGTEANPRLRDYGDLIVLARSGAIDPVRAATEIERVFRARGDWDRYTLDCTGLGAGFAALRQRDWKGTLSTTGYAGAIPANLSEAIDEVRSFAALIETAQATRVDAGPTPF